MSEVKSINSSNLEEASYDSDNRQMVVSFKNGMKWRYFDVPAEIWAGFTQTVSDGGSVGKYFHANIRRLPGEKVEN
jgi:hypothetical protein